MAKKLAAYAGRSLRDPQVRSGAISPLTLVAYRHRGTHQLVKAGEQPVAAPTMLVEELTDTYSVLYDLDATGRVADFVEVGTP